MKQFPHDLDDARFDRTPIAPARTAIHPVRTWDAVRYGVELQVRLGYGSHEIDEATTAARLFTEAAQTERALRGPRPRGYHSAWPEIWRSGAEWFEARLARLQDKLEEYEADKRPEFPTSAAVQRYEEVTLWLRWVHSLNRPRDMQIVWLRSAGAGYDLIADRVGVSPKTARNIKHHQLQVIGDRLRAEMARHNNHLRLILPG